MQSPARLTQNEIRHRKFALEDNQLFLITERNLCLFF